MYTPLSTPTRHCRSISSFPRFSFPISRSYFWNDPRTGNEARKLTVIRKAYEAEGACLAEMALPEVAFLRQHQVVSLPSEPKDESGRLFERPKESLHKAIWDNSEDGVSEWVMYLTNCPMQERSERLGERGDVGLTPIYCAVRADKVEVLKKLIELGADVKNPGATILHYAVRCGSTKVIDFILQKHKDLLNDKDDHGNTALHYAVQSDCGKKNMDKELSKKLIEHGADVNTKNEDGVTPLHLAAQLNKEDVIDLIMDESEDAVDATDYWGRTPLLTAAAYGKKDAIECLSEGSGDRLDRVDNQQRSALFLTVEAGHSIAVKKILDMTHGRTEPDNLLCKADKDGNIPLHIAASKGNIKLMEMLLDSDPLYLKIKKEFEASKKTYTKHEIHEEVQKHLAYSEFHSQLMKKNEAGKTPLHVAAENGQMEVLELLMCTYPRILRICEEQNSDTPLHLACAKGHDKVVRFLLDARANLKARNANGETPFHLAASHGHADLVEYLIGVNKSCIELRDYQERTALRCACDERQVEVINILLKSGADIQSVEIADVIDKGHDDVMSAIIDSDVWVEAMRQCRGKAAEYKMTPLRMMIERMPDVAAKVLNRCTLSDPDNTGTVVFDYQFLEDFRRDNGKPEKQKVEESYKDEDGNYSKTKHLTAVKERDNSTWQSSWGPVGFEKSTHPLMMMVDSGRLDLLEHPLVGSLLHYKWKNFGMWVYFFNILTYLPFVLSLTTFALVVMSPEYKICKEILAGSTETCDTAANTQCGDCGISSSRYNAIFALAVFTILMTVYRFGIEVLQMVQFRLKYLMDWTNWLELVLYSSTVLFVFVFGAPCLCPKNWQWQFGILAVFLAWINLVLFIQKFPLIGIYIVMFLKIVYTFLWTVVLSLLLLTAFGLAFYMAFYEPVYKRTAFSTPASAILRTVAMATGEYDFNGQFHVSPGGESEEQDELAYLPITTAIWVIFIAVMPVLFINMLTGLAVGDVMEILKAAELKKLALQVELVLSVEELVSSVKPIPSKFQSWFGTAKSQNIKVVRKLGCWQSFLHGIWGGQPYMLRENIDNVLNPPVRTVEDQTAVLLNEMKMIKEIIDDTAAANQEKEKEEEKAKAAAKEQADSWQQHLERRMGRLENLLQAIAQHHNIHVEDEPY